MNRLTRRAALVSLLASTLALRRVEPLRSEEAAQGLLLVDGSLDIPDLLGTPVLPGLRRTLLVQPDLVQQWRGGLADLLHAERGAVTALLRWDKSLVLQGLAREAGIHAAATRLSRSLFQVELFAWRRTSAAQPGEVHGQVS